jgi:hypothetical protein
MVLKQTSDWGLVGKDLEGSYAAVPNHMEEVVWEVRDAAKDLHCVPNHYQ